MQVVLERTEGRTDKGTRRRRERMDAMLRSETMIDSTQLLRNVWFGVASHDTEV
jgi:hypothetical protein